MIVDKQGRFNCLARTSRVMGSKATKKTVHPVVQTTTGTGDTNCLIRGLVSTAMEECAYEHSWSRGSALGCGQGKATL